MIESREQKKTAGGRGWFLLVLLLQAVFFLWLYFTRRLPGGWDGFQYFHLQYFFLNDAVFSGEMPQWLPYLTHGTVSTWWASIQHGFLQSALILISGLAGTILRTFNFLTIYQAGLFVDELFLILGVWLLACRVYPSRVTAFFLTVTAAGSSVWATQTWHNFHLYYAIPLALYFGHRFIDTGKWRYFFALANLLTIQVFGNMPYALSVQSLAVFSYFLFYAGLNWHEVLIRLAKVRLNIYAVGALVVSGLILWAASKTLTLNTESIVNYNYGRAAGGESTLESFLTYGRNLGWKKWAEVLFGVSPALDYSLFIGTLPVGLLVLGFFGRALRRGVPFLGAAVVLMLFSMGGIIATALYYAWPTMKFYRHLALVAPLIKIFLILWAGVGCEALLSAAREENSGRLRKAAAVIGMLLIGTGVFLFSISLDTELSRKVLTALVEPGTYRDDHVLRQRIFIPGLISYIDPVQLVPRLQLAAVFSTVIGILLIMLGLGRGIAPYPALIFLMVLHTSQVYSYKFLETRDKTISLSSGQMFYTAFERPPYRVRRVEKLAFDEPRDKLFLLFKFNPIYWSNNLFLFKDEVGHVFRTDHWLKPLDQLMKAYGGQDVNDVETPKGFSRYNYLLFPLTHPAAGRMTGLTHDKIQFFADARFVDDDQKAGLLLKEEGHHPVELLLSGEGVEHFENNTSSSHSPDQRFQYQVNRFSANRIVLSVDVPENGYVYYADVWHPRWRAKLGGDERVVSRANLAYKTVFVPAGKHRVEFYFDDPFFRKLYSLWGFGALCWIVYLVFAVVRCAVKDLSAT